MPLAAFWYSALGAIFMAFFALLSALFLSTSQVIAEAIACSGPSCIVVGTGFVLGLVLVVSIILAYPVLYYLLFYYEVMENSITVNSGILFRQYETVPFDRIQVIDNERGPLLWLFGLTELEIWTASPDQLSIAGEHSSARPDATIILSRETAEALKAHMIRASGVSRNI